MEIAKHSGLWQLEAESDSLSIFSKINNGSFPLSALGLVEDIIHFIRSGN